MLQAYGTTTTLTLLTREIISAHLSICEFCGAALQLLTKTAYALDELTPVDMPPPLRALAEALLAEKSSDKVAQFSRLEAVERADAISRK
jgi:hypothetical protein